MSPGGTSRRALLISKGWVQAVLLVVLFGFFVLGLLAYRTYQAKPPTACRRRAGSALDTASDICKGQQVFLHNGLMESPGGEPRHQGKLAFALLGPWRWSSRERLPRPPVELPGAYRQGSPNTVTGVDGARPHSRARARYIGCVMGAAAATSGAER